MDLHPSLATGKCRYLQKLPTLGRGPGWCIGDENTCIQTTSECWPCSLLLQRTLSNSEYSWTSGRTYRWSGSLGPAASSVVASLIVGQTVWSGLYHLPIYVVGDLGLQQIRGWSSRQSVCSVPALGSLALGKGMPHAWALKLTSSPNIQEWSYPVKFFLQSSSIFHVISPLSSTS